MAAMIKYSSPLLKNTCNKDFIPSSTFKNHLQSYSAVTLFDVPPPVSRYHKKLEDGLEEESPEPEADRRIFAKKIGGTERFSIRGTAVRAWLRLASEGDPTKPLKYVPGEGCHKQEIKPEVPVEQLADPLPFHPEEAGDDRVAEQVAMVFALSHVPQRLGFWESVLLHLLLTLRVSLCVAGMINRGRQEVVFEVELEVFLVDFFL